MTIITIPDISLLRAAHSNDWFAIGVDLAEQILDRHDDTAANLRACVRHIDVRHPEASCLALRGWLDAHAPELLHSLTAEDAQDLVEGMEGCL